MKWQHLLVGCGVCAGLGVLIVVGGLVYLGVGIETGRIPDTVALPKSKIHSNYLKTLRELGIIAAGEEVQYFYSEGFLSIEEGGNLFTDSRVIAYQKDDEGLQIYEAAYPQIAEVEFVPSESWLDDSTITVTTHDGEWFVLFVSSESQGDHLFYKRLKELWQQAGGGTAEDSGGALQPEAPL